jgi:hypothetical protein
MNDIFYASSLTSSPCIIRNEASVKRVTVVVYAIYEQVALTITHHLRTSSLFRVYPNGTCRNVPTN